MKKEGAHALLLLEEEAARRERELEQLRQAIKKRQVAADQARERAEHELNYLRERQAAQERELSQDRAEIERAGKEH